MPSYFYSLILIAVLAATPYSARGAEYRLGPQDKVKIKVYDWRPEANDMHEWPALTGEFTVGANGSLSLPVVDEVNASNATPATLAKAIGQQMQSRLGLTRAPFVSVEISEYRPLYILGVVAKPGEYAFRPGLTVLQAMGVAGGLERPDDTIIRSLVRDKITARGELDELQAERLQLLMRQARLRATIQDKADIPLPPEVAARTSESGVARIVEEETDLFRSSRQSVSDQVSSLGQSKKLLQQELKSLDSKDTSLARETDLARENLSKVNTLIARQLAVSSSQLAMEQVVSQYENSELDVQLSRLRAQQSLGEADRQSLEVRNKAKALALADANETRLRLASLDEKIVTASALVEEADARLGESGTTASDNYEAHLSFTVFRDDGKGLKSRTVKEADFLYPGDTLKIERVSRPYSLVKSTD